MKHFIAFYLGLTLTFLVSCDSHSPKTNDEPQQISVVDDLGRALILDAHPKKVMALAPSITEYLALICEKQQLLARTQNCDFPVWVNKLPEVVNYPHLDLELILKLKPDLIITHKGITPETDLVKLAEFGIPTYVFLIDSVAKISKTAKQIGYITGNKQRGIEVCDSLEQVKNNLMIDRQAKLTVISLVSTQPMFAFGRGSLVDEMMTYTQIDNLIDSSFVNAYPQLDEEYILRKDPNILLIPASASKEDFFIQHPNLRALSAYKKQQLYQLDKDHISRQGPRIFYGLQALNNIR